MATEAMIRQCAKCKNRFYHFEEIGSLIFTCTHQVLQGGGLQQDEVPKMWSIYVLLMQVLLCCSTAAPNEENIQGGFFNWPPLEFAKCWPVSNRFQKNVRVPDWPPP